MLHGHLGSLTILCAALATSAAACGSAAPSTRAPASSSPDPHTFDPCAGGEALSATRRCEDWPSWPRINQETFRSRGHRKALVDIHVETRFADVYRAGRGPMPVGMRIVKAAHAEVDGAPAEVTGLTVMAKMEPGYDPEHGDWYYGVYDPTGTVAQQQGKIAMCIGCHEKWSDHDYLGGAPGLWR